MNDVSIVSYEPRYQPDFKRLNVEWISQYFTVETHDLEQLDQPETHVLPNDGQIFFVLIDGEVVGCVAMVNMGATGFELAKMAVSPNVQGQGIGKRLCLAAIDYARQLGVKTVWLESNRVLTPALTMYERVGFREVPRVETPYARADIRMEINMQEFVKMAFIIADDLPVGLAINTGALLGATLGNKLPYMIAEGLPDGSGVMHLGLSWLPMPILKADRTAIKAIADSARDAGLLVTDVSEPAQTARTFEDYRQRLADVANDELVYSGVGLYGDKKVVNKLVGKLTLYR
jgi:N-acetylglutamate synthase-like GNAT family acetyltransferase